MSDTKWKFTAEDCDLTVTGTLVHGLVMGMKTVDSNTVPAVSLEKANAKLAEWLESAPAVYAMGSLGEKPDDWLFVNSRRYHACGQRAKDAVTHTARLIMVEPIVLDTAESLLLEILEKHDCENVLLSLDLYDRARKLLKKD